MIEKTSDKPFTTTRLLVGSFLHADSLLRNILKEINPRTFPLPAYNIIMQPMEMTEGGISDVEMRAFKDLAEQAGGIKVRVIESAKALTDYELKEIINTDEEYDDD